MPPKKKAKASAGSTPLTETQPKTPQEAGAATRTQEQQDEEILNDPWSDDQETQLFKSMMRWKPTGLHKHFRMLSIHNNMRSHGFVTDDAPHTRIPGVWRKLDQLYSLPALDERENAFAFNDVPDPLDPEEAYTLPEFELPEDDYGELMWQKRFHSPKSAASSPGLWPVQEEKMLFHPNAGLLKDLPEELRAQKKAESVSGATSTPKNTKSKSASKSSAKSAKGLKAAAKNTKAVSESAEDDEDDEDEEDEEDGSDESEAETAPTTRRTNRTSKAKAAPKRTRKR